MSMVRLPQGELRDEIRQAVYDTIQLGNSDVLVGSRRFFSSVQGKPLSQSNLRQNNLLETAVSFRIQGMGFDSQNYVAANKTVLPFLMDHSSISVQVGEKFYWRGPLAFICGRINTFHALAGTTDAAEIYQHYGATVAAPVVLGPKHVVDVLPLQTFFAEWVVDTPTVISAPTINTGTILRFIFSLKGLMRRPVQ